MFDGYLSLLSSVNSMKLSANEPLESPPGTITGTEFSS